MTRMIFLILIWIFSSSLEATEEKTQVTGFVYSLGDNTYMLTREPNLKTCCMGSQKRRESQFFFSSQTPFPKGTLITLQGTLVQKNHTDGGFRYHLEGAEEVFKEKKLPLLSLFLGACFLGIAFFLWGRTK